MRGTARALFACMMIAMAVPALAQVGLATPKTVPAGAAFSIETTGAGNATLYIVGLGRVIRRDVQLGGAISVPAGTLYNAGQYLAFLSTSPNNPASFEVVPAKVANATFLARPSRLPVGVQGGITGAVYLFDSYGNLVTLPAPVTFDLSTPNGAGAHRTVGSKNGAAWVAMDSSPREGAAHFVARAGDVSTTRIIGQVPGDPCSLKMSARPDRNKIAVETEPVRDCSGNTVPDGTIVTFTESYNGQQSTVDVPLKRGVAKVEMPAYPGANISVASGVVLGNQIHWGR